MQTIGNHWDTVLHAQLCSPQYAALQRALDVEYRTTQVFPPREHVLRALRLTDYDGVKAVILGQDPYHRMGQANGLAFAVNEGVPLPPSLQNIYREIEDDLGVAMPRAGTLIGWQKQGVLLLNTTLTGNPLPMRSLPRAAHAKSRWLFCCGAAAPLPKSR